MLFEDELRPLRLNPSLGIKSSGPALFITIGTGSFLCEPSVRLKMSLKDMPIALAVALGALVAVYFDESGCGSSGAKAGVVWECRESWRKGGSSYVLEKGRRRGECAGVASGVWSGVGDSESWENVGDEGAVELGELGRERLACR